MNTTAATQHGAAILWALKTQGDINEAHKGGNAGKELRRRMAERGFAVDDKVFSNQIQALKKKGAVKVLIKGRTTFAIRLLPGATMPDFNPLAGSDVAVIEPSSSAPAPINDEDEKWRVLPLHDRMDLVDRIQRSIREDLYAIREAIAPTREG